MGFSSLSAVIDAAIRAIGRFPFAILCAWIAGFVANWMVLVPGEHHRLVAVMLAAALGIPLFFALALFRERRPPERAVWPPTVLEAVTLLGLVVFVLIWPSMTEAVQMRSYFQLTLFAQAVAATLPYLGVREPRGFWQYNRALLMRLVVASVFAGVLHTGLQGALFALKPLFGISISEKSFLLLASAVYFGFLPLYFFAGIPRNLGELDRQDDYPAVIRVMAVYILVPLVAVYQTLLTGYLIKVILTGQWPKGLIGWLVSAEATFGILAILLVWPVRDRDENRWVGTFARVFYIALLPSIVMLWLAIGKRIAQYGVTEDRYFVAVLATWLAGISAYFIVRRDGDIRWIPATLGLLAIFTMAGPWSAYAVSLGSQQKRLVRLLHDYGLNVDQPPRPGAPPPPLEARKDLSSLLDYLFRSHGERSVVAVVGPAAADSALARDDRGRALGRSERLMKRMGVTYTASWEGSALNRTVFFRAPYTGPKIAVPLEGYSLHVRLDGGLPQSFKLGSREFKLRLDGRNSELVLDEGRETLSRFPLARALELSRTVATPPDSLEGGLPIEGRGSRRAMLVLASMSAARYDSLMIYEIAEDLYLADAPVEAMSASGDTLAVAR